MQYLKIKSNDYAFIRKALDDNIVEFLKRNKSTRYVKDIIADQQEWDDVSDDEAIKSIADDIKNSYYGIFPNSSKNVDMAFILYPYDDQYAYAAIYFSTSDNSIEWVSTTDDDWYCHLY